MQITKETFQNFNDFHVVKVVCVRLSHARLKITFFYWFMRRIFFLFLWVLLASTWFEWIHLMFNQFNCWFTAIKHRNWDFKHRFKWNRDLNGINHLKSLNNLILNSQFDKFTKTFLSKQTKNWSKSKTHAYFNSQEQSFILIQGKHHRRLIFLPFSSWKFQKNKKKKILQIFHIRMSKK